MTPRSLKRARPVRLSPTGGVAEWSKVTVLKTVARTRPGGESLLLFTAEGRLDRRADLVRVPCDATGIGSVPVAAGGVVAGWELEVSRLATIDA